MIRSPEEFKRWFDATDTTVFISSFRPEVDPGVLVEAAARYPECRAEILRRRDVPIEALEMLRHDEDEGVQWAVRCNRLWHDAHPEDANPWEDDPHRPMQFRLSDVEREVLSSGLAEWAGAARCTEEMAVAIGFASVEDLFREGERIGNGIKNGIPQTRTDWTRALLATEVVFASQVMGAAHDWSIATGLDDDSTFRHLRAIQRKLVTSEVVGRVFGTRPSAPSTLPMPNSDECDEA